VTGRHGKKAPQGCPCGYQGDSSGRCYCSPDRVARYRRRISGPLLDRIDVQLDVPAIPAQELQNYRNGESSSIIRGRVETARARMLVRQGKSNALLEAREIEQYSMPDVNGIALLQKAISRLRLSARSYHRILKVARSIADLAGAEDVTSAHIAEAIGYRRGLDS